jgi:hypothetical protein
MTQAMATPVLSGSRGVSTLDVLKTLAVVLMIIDHLGLYFWVEDSWLRLLGRGAAVIFGFLIGFSSSTRVPASWVFLGLGLTLLNGLLFPDAEERALDILISLALTRVLTPFFERLHARHPLWLVPLAIVLALLTEPVNEHLEYGTEVMVMALLGIAVRLETGRLETTTAREALALVALIAMSLLSIRHFEFTGWQAGACTALLATTILLLSRFQRQSIETPGVLGPILRFCGRNTLWIYAIHLAAFQVAAWWIADPAEE